MQDDDTYYNHTMMTTCRYILFGAGWFCYLENWGFERASEFCLMTLLTIGYGNIVPATFWGRFFMIFYTSVGLCVAGFFIIAVEDVIIQDTNESPLLVSALSVISFSTMTYELMSAVVYV